MVLRRIFGPKRDGVTGGWRKLKTKGYIILLFAKCMWREWGRRGTRIDYW
jgi:hypothetical protein